MSLHKTLKYINPILKFNKPVCELIKKHYIETICVHFSLFAVSKNSNFLPKSFRVNLFSASSNNFWGLTWKDEPEKHYKNEQEKGNEPHLLNFLKSREKKRKEKRIPLLVSFGYLKDVKELKRKEECKKDFNFKWSFLLLNKPHQIQIFFFPLFFHTKYAKKLESDFSLHLFQSYFRIYVSKSRIAYKKLFPGGKIDMPIAKHSLREN